MRHKQAESIAPLVLLSLISIFGCRGFIDSAVEPTPTHEYEPYQYGVVDIAFSPDCKYMATAHTMMWSSRSYVSLSLGESPPTFVKLWMVSEEANLATFSVYKVRNESLQFTPDSSRLVGLCGPDLFHWDVSQQSFHESPNERVEAVSPDSQLIVRFHEKDRYDVLDIVDAERGVTLATMDTEITNPSVKFSPDSSLLAIAGSPKDKPFHITIFDWRNDEIVTQFNVELVGLSNYYWSFSPNGRTLVFASVNDNRVRLYDTRSGELKSMLGEHSGQIWCVAFSPDGRLVASGGEGESGSSAGDFKLWDVDRAAEIAAITDDSTWGITAVGFSPDSRQLVTGDGDGKLKSWNVADLYGQGIP